MKTNVSLPLLMIAILVLIPIGCSKRESSELLCVKCKDSWPNPFKSLHLETRIDDGLGEVVTGRELTRMVQFLVYQTDVNNGRILEITGCELGFDWSGFGLLAWGCG